ncbi:chromate transporter [Calorimonas adulescens]|uniref:Chromate transporter n=1 Tax=Calorimonas adulescens TaxID=2606906 RepID=A0A5D8QFE3_9THEO|nr:chromate transporter [Calorimonas adulescens]TZE82919.1 chromate transporter [Calorimonas adulescens]
MILLRLFYSFFKIGAFSFGGGYAVLAFIQKEIVNLNHWLLPSEFVDVVAISQITPGPIAINAATFVGYKVAGYPGSAVATLGVTLPSFLIIIVIARFFIRFQENHYVKAAFDFIRPATIGLIAAAAVTTAQASIVDIKSALIGIFIFILLYYMKLDTILAIALSAILGLLLYR